VCIGRDDAEVQRRADNIGRDLDELRESSITGTPAEAIERIGEFTDHGATRLYLQVLDIHDLDHLELIASEVMPHV
jgi:alkanesulfonate monooxygenase SsuD/methylene tetrahydromethanopterin reductase-like flavin-dependent oxidoreductase (luciferase family)